MLDERNEDGSFSLGDAEYDLFVVGSDARADGKPSSGIASLTVKVDGVTRATATPSCATCPAELAYSYNAKSAGYGSGQHVLNVIATDVAGNVFDDRFVLQVDRENDPKYADDQETPGGQAGSPDPEPRTSACMPDLSAVDLVNDPDSLPYCDEFAVLNDRRAEVASESPEEDSATATADLTPRAAALPNTAPSLQKGGSGWGLSDDRLYFPGIDQDPKLDALGLSKVRMIVPYNLMSAGGTFGNAVRNEVASAMTNARKGCGTGGRCFDVLVAFGRRKDDYTFLPTVVNYMSAVTQFRREYPFVREFESWNEPNHPSQPTSRKARGDYSGAQRAGQFYARLQKHCDAPPAGLSTCAVAAGTFADAPSISDQDTRFIDEYQKGTGTAAWRKPAWSVHVYSEAFNRNTTFIRHLLRRTARPAGEPGSSPKIWITEGGGRVDKHRSAANRRGSEAKAGADTDWMLSNIATGLSSRVTRFYYFSWMGQRSFDSGLTRYYDPCPSPRSVSCKTRRETTARARRPEIYDRYKAYTRP